MADESFFGDAAPTVAPAAPPAPPPVSVDMETATRGLPPTMFRDDNPAVDQPTFGRGTKKPEERRGERGDTTPPPPPPEFSRLESTVENLEKRLADTQSSFHQVAAERNQFQQMLQGMQQQTQQQQQQQAQAQQAQAMKPPQLTDEELEAVQSDPKKLQQYMLLMNEHAIRQARTEYGPLVQWAQNASALNEVQQGLLEDVAVTKARDLMVKEDGIDETTFNEMVQPTRKLLMASYQHPAQQRATLLNPEAIRWGMKMAMSQNGTPMPTRTAAPAPPGPPSPRSTTPQQATRQMSKPMSIRLAEERLGVKIPQERWADNEKIGAS